MIRQLPVVLALLTLAALPVACGSTGTDPADVSGDDDDDGTSLSVNLLVVPPLGSNVPTQIVSNLTSAQLGDGDHDLELSAGSAVTLHIRSTDSIPIDGAAVRVRMRGAVGYDIAQVTGASGDVTLTLGAATYDIEVDPNPALYPTLPPRAFPALVVPPGGAPQELTLTMEPGYKIRGTLRDPSGSALPQWNVSARPPSGTGRSTKASTSMVGAFEIYVPTTGSWNLQITPPAIASGAPSALDPIEVTADIEGYVFQFPALGSHVVSGTVKGIGGLTTDFSNVTIRARAPALLVDQPEPGVVISFTGSTTTDNNGNFSLPVLAGTYTLSIEPTAGFEYSHAVISNLEVTSDTVLVETLTTLYPKVSVGGTATSLTSGTGTEGARVRLTTSDGTTAYQFADPDGTTGEGVFSVLANVGNYVAEVLPAPDSGLVRLSQPLSVATTVTNLSLQLGDGLVVRGRIYDADGEPLELVTVVALDPATGLPVGSNETVSDSDGDWVLTVPFL